MWSYLQAKLVLNHSNGFFSNCFVLFQLLQFDSFSKKQALYETDQAANWFESSGKFNKAWFYVAYNRLQEIEPQKCESSLRWCINEPKNSIIGYQPLQGVDKHVLNSYEESLKTYCFCIFFLLFRQKRWNTVKKKKKCLKTVKIVFQTVFGCAQHPKVGWNTERLSCKCPMMEVAVVVF